MIVGLEFIASQLQRVRDELRPMRARLDRVEDRRAGVENREGGQGDARTVPSGMVLRWSSEHIAWSGVQRQLKRLEERLARLEGAQPTSP